MLLERYYDDTLAQASYLIGCEQALEAIVIDPNAAHDYQASAAARGLRIRWVTETHIHADFLSGSRALAERTGASLLLSGHGGGDWSYRAPSGNRPTLLCDGDSITVGKVRLDVWHTPGHTPEHVVFLVTDTATGDRPMGMVSGDFLFVGDVGRPDLLERAAGVSGTMEEAARQLYRSLRRLRTLPDYVQVWPGHGAGSACGKALGSVPQSTLGYERLYNPALQFDDEASFARWVLADQPEPPAYFAVMKRWNRDGPPPRAHTGPPAWLDAAGVRSAIERDAQVVDVRSAAEYARGHVPRTLNIPASKSLATYAGTVLSYDRPVVLILGAPEQRDTVTRQLWLIGLDVAGVAPRDVVEELTRGGAESVPAIAPEALTATLEGASDPPLVIDVRGRSEWNHGHLDAATHIFLGDLAERSRTLDRDVPIVVHCQSGTRSSIAASLLLSRGFRNVASLTGGVDAWRRAGLPLVTED